MTEGRLVRRGSAVEGGFSYIGAVAALLVLSVIAGLIPAETETAKYIASYITTIALQICFLLAAFIPYRLTRSQPRYSFAQPSAKACAAAPAVAVICVAAFYGAAVCFGALLGAIGYSPAPSSGDMSEPYVVALTALSAVLVAPVCEERLFRGSYLSSLCVMFGRKSSGRRVIWVIAVCGLVFAFIHTRPEQTVYQFFFGAALAYLTIRTCSVVPAVIAHAVSNIIGVVLELPAAESAVGAAVNAAFGTWCGAAVFVLVSAGLCVGGAFALRALMRRLGGGEPCDSFVTEGENGYKDDGGTVAGAVFGALSFAVCAALWIATFAVGMAG